MLNDDAEGAEAEGQRLVGAAVRQLAVLPSSLHQAAEEGADHQEEEEGAGQAEESRQEEEAAAVGVGPTCYRCVCYVLVF